MRILGLDLGTHTGFAVVQCAKVMELHPMQQGELRSKTDPF